VTLPTSLTEPARAIAALLIERGQTVTVCESSAGGLISAALLHVAGASAYYLGGTVIYTLAGTRLQLAGEVPFPEGVKGASEGWARFLAEASRVKLGADWSVSETGASGPSGNPYGRPAGHAWVGVAGPDGTVEAEHVLTGQDDRVANMEAFAAAALGLLRRHLLA
jgi:PncC family amidohydrolase